MRVLFLLSHDFRVFVIYNCDFDGFTAGVDKSRTCARDVLEIINFTNCRFECFFNKFAHEHTFSVF